jgi:hypothetical protein
METINPKEAIDFTLGSTYGEGGCDALKARIAELESEAANLREVMVAAAEEINKHWDAHCDKEGYGPMSLCRRLEDGLAVIYPGYSVGAFKRQAERIAELESEVTQMQNELENLYNEMDYG